MPRRPCRPTRETIFRRKQGMVQTVIPDKVLPKLHEDRRLVSLFFPSVLPFKARGRNPASKDLPIRNGDA